VSGAGDERDDHRPRGAPRGEPRLDPGWFDAQVEMDRQRIRNRVAGGCVIAGITLLVLVVAVAALSFARPRSSQLTATM
jgi:hypothetical protein